jgi:hypothetical protein
MRIKDHCVFHLLSPFQKTPTAFRESTIKKQKNVDFPPPPLFVVVFNQQLLVDGEEDKPTVASKP